jgi:Fe-S cluster assembly protein SufD
MTQQINPLVDQCQNLGDHTQKLWLSPMRQQALESFLQRGLPTRKEEDWKYTDLSHLSKNQFQLPEQTGPIDRELTDYDCHRMVFVNGHFNNELSNLTELGRDIILMPMSEAVSIFEPFLNDCLPEAVTARYPFGSLNRALMQDGYYLYIPQSTVVEKPIHIVHHLTENTDPQMAHLGHLVWAAPNSQATIIEEFTGSGSCYWQNVVHQFYLKPAARINYYKLQNEAEGAFHTHTVLVDQARDTAFNSANYSLGSSLSRDDWYVGLNDKGAHCAMTGLYMPKGRQLVDHHLQIEHNAPHTQSDLYYKGLASERGRAVYNGKVIVPHDSQKVEANQYNPNLLLSNKAEIDTKPELLINADDVRCTHGSTVGFLDAQALNYLRCRGLSYEDAMGMLLYAFAQDAVEYVKHSGFAETVHQTMTAELPFNVPQGQEVA